MIDGQKQRIITVTREFGSGGKAIAQKLAEAYHIPLYEKNILELAGIPWSEEVEDFYTSDMPHFLSTRHMRGMTRTNEEIFCAMEFQFLTEQAEAGHSFIVLGHCAEYILRDNPNVFSVFAGADEKFRIHRTMINEKLSEEEARKMCRRHSRKRKAYHKQYCPWGWADASHYDLCMKTDVLGIDSTFEVIKKAADLRFDQMKTNG